MDDELQEYIVLFLIFLISIALVQTISKAWASTSTSPPRLPPGPRALPIIGHLHLLSLPIDHQALHRLSNRYGPLMHIRIGSVMCVVGSSPERAEEFLKTQEISFCDRPRNTASSFLTYGSIALFTSAYGPYWKFIKKICMTQLLGINALDRHLPIRREEIRQFLKLILIKAEAGKAVNIRQETERMTTSLMARITMNQKFSDDEVEACKLIKMNQEMYEIVGKFNLSDIFGFCKKLDLQGFGKKLGNLRARYDAMIERIIQDQELLRRRRRKKQKEEIPSTIEDDVLNNLLDMAEDNSSSEQRLTREHIKAFILDISIGGIRTSAVTAEMAMVELIKNPNIMEKVSQEIDSVIGKERLVEEADITNLPYLQAIVKETLRLHPAVPLISRESTENCVISGDYEIPAKTQVLINVWAIHRDPRYWENPLEFRPERFLQANGRNNKGNLEVMRSQHLSYYLPFGSGRRSCPATSQALLMLHTQIAVMIQCFNWKVIRDGENSTIKMEEETVSGANSLICIPVARLKPFPSI